MKGQQQTFKQLASGLAKESIVTMALQRFLEQVITEIHETQIEPRQKALDALMARPHGCAFCHSGTIINPAKGHDSNCGYRLAAEASS